MGNILEALTTPGNREKRMEKDRIRGKMRVEGMQDLKHTSETSVYALLLYSSKCITQIIILYTEGPQTHATHVRGILQHPGHNQHPLGNG